MIRTTSWITAIATLVLAIVAIVTVYYQFIHPKELDSQPSAQTIHTQTSKSGNIIEVRSNPKGAEVFIDWKFKGYTPLLFKEAQRITGFLVVVKEGYKAAYRNIDFTKSSILELILSPEQSYPQHRVLLIEQPPPTASTLSDLRELFIKQGLIVIGPDRIGEYQQKAKLSGGLSHRGFRAWTRAYFSSNILVSVKLRQYRRNLNQEPLMISGAKEAVKGVQRINVVITLELFDLTSGDQIGSIIKKDTEISSSPTRGYQNAYSRAAAAVSKDLIKWLDDQRNKKAK